MLERAGGGELRARYTAIGLMLLLAACGKSAQVPLQSWLGDAMEGPTPVSALIHAATMVTAGVYLITRSGAIFNAAPDAQTAVVVVGAVTLLFGAIVGCAKDDIKKALAGSTMSQIGYMILAAGLGPIGYVFAIMHLVTHGFFKAGLFLGAGSVMHGMNDEVDMRKYGGLRKYMPVTFVTFGLGYLAIIGFPGLSGFFSKDKIIEAAFAKGGTEGWILGAVTLLGAAITAYYMTRVMLMTFFGEERWRHAKTPSPAEPSVEPAAETRRARRAAPARVPEVHDDPDDRPGLRLGLRGRHLQHRRPVPELAGAGHRPRATATRRSAQWTVTARHHRLPADRRRPRRAPSTAGGRSRPSRRAARCSPGPPAATCSRTTSTTWSWSAAASTSPARWSTSTTAWSTESSTAPPPRSAGSPAGCASCRTASPAATRSRCSEVLRCSSPRLC